MGKRAQGCGTRRAGTKHPHLRVRWGFPLLGSLLLVPWARQGRALPCPSTVHPGFPQQDCRTGRSFCIHGLTQGSPASLCATGAAPKPAGAPNPPPHAPFPPTPRLKKGPGHPHGENQPGARRKAWPRGGSDMLGALLQTRGRLGPLTSLGFSVTFLPRMKAGGPGGAARRGHCGEVQLRGSGRGMQNAGRREGAGGFAAPRGLSPPGTCPPPR